MMHTEQAFFGCFWRTRESISSCTLYLSLSLYIDTSTFLYIYMHIQQTVDPFNQCFFFLLCIRISQIDIYIYIFFFRRGRFLVERGPFLLHGYFLYLADGKGATSAAAFSDTRERTEK